MTWATGDDRVLLGDLERDTGLQGLQDFVSAGDAIKDDRSSEVGPRLQPPPPVYYTMIYYYIIYYTMLYYTIYYILH